MSNVKNTDVGRNKKNSSQINNLIFADGFVGFEILKYLIHQYPDDICGVITTSKNDIYEFAKNAGKKTYIYENSNSFICSLPKKIDIGFLLWWPYIIHSPLLELPIKGFINTHPSLLPYNKGKHPNFWCIVEQKPYGVTLHKIGKGVDDGPIIAQEELSYDWTDTGGTLYKRGLFSMIELFKISYPKIREGTFNTVAQDQIASFHHSSELEPASIIHLDQCYLAKDLLNLLRARTFDSFPACNFTDDGEIYEVRVAINKKVNHG